MTGRPSKLLLILTLLLLGFAACGRKAASEPTTDVSLQPVSSTGADPFTPPVGTNSTNVTPPPNSAGTVTGSAVGLFGGTLNASTCDKTKMVTFLQAHQDKAVAWAGVLGITPNQIPKFVSKLTPAILRSDTFVVNHGFANGIATAVPSVLQAGTAVLVDSFGFPVTRCFCGNPLTKPTKFTKITFVGPRWTSFSTTNITVIQSTTVVVNQFTLIEPKTNVSFDRPRGTGGEQDTNVTQPTTTGPPPIGPAPGPTPSAPPAPGQPGPQSQPGSPQSSPAAPGTTAPGTPGVPVPPGSPGTRPASPSAPATSPAPRPTSAAPASPSRSGSPSGSPSTSPSAKPSNASWIVGDCFVHNGTLHATAVVRNNGSTATHSYQATVAWGPTDNPFATKVVAFTHVRPGQTDQADATAPAAPPAPTSGTVPCAITKLVDESGKQPAMGPALTPPPNTQPTATPSESPTESPTESPSAPETPTLPTKPLPVPS